MNTEVKSSKSLAEVAFDEGTRLARDRNICAVGQGVKRRGGAAQSGSCLVYFVRRKLPTHQDFVAHGTWPVPREVDGYATDVVEVGNLAAASSDRAAPAGRRGTRICDPLIGGVATMSLGTSAAGPGGYGTLGGICFHPVRGTPFALSNAHVWGQTVGAEVVQPVAPTAVFGAAASLSQIGGSQLVRTSVPAAMVPPVVLANSIAQTELIAGGDLDALTFGQGATSVPATARTDNEQLVVVGPAVDLPPAGRRASPTISWKYTRTLDTTVVSASASAPRSHSKLLAARRLFTDASSYTQASGVNVRLYAEIVPAAGGGAVDPLAHHVVAYLYPLATGERMVARVLRPTSRQTTATATASFSGFPAPARVGVAALPVFQSGFGVDSESPGTFVSPPSGSLAAGLLVLRLPAAPVRLFVPPSTQVVMDIDLGGSAGPMQVVALNSAGDSVGAVSTTAGTSGRSNVSVSASEIVELRLTGVTNAQLFGVTSRRSSPETTSPLCYSGAVSVSALSKVRWGASLFVQELASGIPEAANVIEIASGATKLIADCAFDVT